MSIARVIVESYRIKLITSNRKPNKLTSINLKNSKYLVLGSDLSLSWRANSSSLAKLTMQKTLNNFKN